MELDAWLQTLSTEIDTGDVVLDETGIQTLLDLARDSAHEVERIAAPLTTFLVGVAVGRGAPLSAVAARATGLVLQQTPPDPAQQAEPRDTGS